MDKIFITALTAEAIIGIYDWEREVKQRLEVDLEMWVDLSAAAKSDAIEDTLNYKSIAKRVLAFVEYERARTCTSAPVKTSPCTLKGARSSYVPSIQTAVPNSTIETLPTVSMVQVLDELAE